MGCSLSKPITIYPRPDSPDLKAMIQALRVSKADSNPYFGRSESDIARMLLSVELTRQHKRFCPDRAVGSSERTA